MVKDLHVGWLFCKIDLIFLLYTCLAKNIFCSNIHYFQFNIASGPARNQEILKRKEKLLRWLKKFPCIEAFVVCRRQVKKAAPRQ